ncbi:MAG TPA: 5'-methylthioadenosine/S-adenosylhomocysteine nucleosidase [Ktedonobacterales bacterium]|nr:5'-methylthioadenosine/S-adenosylhomocysteine nucleosidase [Ktedonobacterales bacterium]
MPSIVAPQVLVVAPLAEERAVLHQAFAHCQVVDTGEELRIPCAYIPSLRTLIAPGGHGKAQFAAQTQYLIDQYPSAELVICAGVAGSLHPAASVGDVVVGTDTIEHDYQLRFAVRPLPRFPGHEPSLKRLREAATGISEFRVIFGIIASGDEDVVSVERAEVIHAQTGAVCVAWEGSGAARAAAFSGLDSLEIRAITDTADKAAPQDFVANLTLAMGNLAVLLECLLKSGKF